jgi:dihydroorotase
VPTSIDIAAKLAAVPEIAGFKIYPGDLEHRMDVVEKLLREQPILAVLHPELPEAEKSEYENLSLRAVARGCHWETAAVEYIASLAEKARLHITHASCHTTIDAAKRHGLTVDATPHHILYPAPLRGDCLLKVNPPLRTTCETKLLLKALLDGKIDALASDHAPHASWEKEGDPLTCPPGIPWLEAWPHVVSCLVASGALRIEEYAALLSTQPAEIIGARRCLAPGCPASITILRFTHSRFHAPTYSKAKRIPYFMERLCTETVASIAGGRLAYLDPAWRIK